MSDIESHEEMFVDSGAQVFDFKVGNSFEQTNLSRDSYFHFMFDEEYDIDFSKPASIKDINEKTVQISFGGYLENELLLSGQRFGDNTYERDDENAERDYLLIFDETTKTFTLELLDCEFHVSNDFSTEVNGIEPKLEPLDSDFERKFQEEIEDQSYVNGEYFPDEEEDYVEKFTESMESMKIEGNGENGIAIDYDDYDNYDDDNVWMEDEELEEVDAPLPQVPSEDDMYGPIDDEDEVTKYDTESTNTSSSGGMSSTSSDSDNDSGDDGSDSSGSEMESEQGDFEPPMRRSINSIVKSPRTKKKSNTTDGKKSNGVTGPISLAALLGDGVEEQGQYDSGSSDDSD